jgi:hypothetical protein
MVIYCGACSILLLPEALFEALDRSLRVEIDTFEMADFRVVKIVDLEKLVPKQ